jgi:D-glycero-D-manno-heptose 1,7-bisphosphate phosphatase
MGDNSNRIRLGCPEAPRLTRPDGEPVRPIAFLDRDGVVNADKGYVHSIDEFVWMPGALAAIKFLNDRGFVVGVVTNQSGIGRGYYEEEAFLELTEWMLREVDKSGGYVDVVYYCPHHPESADPRYLSACRARKPGPGMLERADEEFAMDRRRSFLVGNRESDMGAARAFGIPGHLYEDGDLEKFVRAIVKD